MKKDKCNAFFENTNRLFLCSLLLGLVFFPALGFELPPGMQPVMDTTVNDIFNGRFERALALADSTQQSDPASPVGPFLHIFILGLRDLDRGGAARDSAQFMQSYAQTVRLIAASERTQGRSSFSAMLLGFSQASNASFYLNRKQYYDALKTGLDAIKNLKQAKALDSTNYDVDFFLGLYEYARAELKKRMWWALFWYSGNAESGIQKLRNCGNNGRFTAAAARLSLADIYIREKQFALSHNLLDRMNVTYPGSRFILWKRVKWHEDQKDHAATAAIYDSLARSYEQECPECYNALYTRNQQVHLLVEAHQIPEAEALCRHILEQYDPKTVDGDLYRDTQKLLQRIGRR
ncbi:MAG: hypothetical protein PHC61_07600 [Chitinivibrionales bacterium]|nr:hypothetical protein [Chitinivibrionales bacterium]